MTSEEKYAYWLDLAQYDLDTAQAMYTGGRWFYVAFMCQQALEKLCKGIYNFFIDDNVPKTHNIRFILKKIETSLAATVKPELYILTDTLTSIYLNNRYPDFASKSTINVNKSKAADLLEKTKEAFAWLLTLKT